MIQNTLKMREKIKGETMDKYSNNCIKKQDPF